MDDLNILRGKLSVQIVDAFNRDISKVGVVSRLLGPHSIRAFPEHDLKAAPRQKGPAGRFRIEGEAECVSVVPYGDGEISYGKN